MAPKMNSDSLAASISSVRVLSVRYRVIKGWTLMLARMVEGDKVRVWIPEALAYEGKPGRPAGVLVFDIELLAIVR